jgi:hypothetical protein
MHFQKIQSIFKYIVMSNIKYGGKPHLIAHNLKNPDAKKAAHAIVDAVHFIKDPNVNILQSRKIDIENMAKDGIAQIEAADHLDTNGFFASNNIIQKETIDQIHEKIITSIQHEIAPTVNNLVVKPIEAKQLQNNVSARELEITKHLSDAQAQVTRKHQEIELNNQAMSDLVKTNELKGKRIILLTNQRINLTQELNAAKAQVIQLESDKHDLEVKITQISTERASAIQERDALSVRLNGDKNTVGVLQQLSTVQAELATSKADEAKSQQEISALQVTDAAQKLQIQQSNAEIKRLLAVETQLTNDLQTSQALNLQIPILKTELQDTQIKLAKKIKEYVDEQGKNHKLTEAKKKVDDRLTKQRALFKNLQTTNDTLGKQLAACLGEKAQAEVERDEATRQKQQAEVEAAAAKLKQEAAERSTLAAQAAEQAAQAARAASEQVTLTAQAAEQAAQATRAVALTAQAAAEALAAVEKTSKEAAELQNQALQGDNVSLKQKVDDEQKTIVKLKSDLAQAQANESQAKTNAQKAIDEKKQADQDLTDALLKKADAEQTAQEALTAKGIALAAQQAALVAQAAAEKATLDEKNAQAAREQAIRQAQAAQQAAAQQANAQQAGQYETQIKQLTADLAQARNTQQLAEQKQTDAEDALAKAQQAAQQAVLHAEQAAQQAHALQIRQITHEKEQAEQALATASAILQKAQADQLVALSATQAAQQLYQETQAKLQLSETLANTYKVEHEKSLSKSNESHKKATKLITQLKLQEKKYQTEVQQLKALQQQHNTDLLAAKTAEQNSALARAQAEANASAAAVHATQMHEQYDQEAKARQATEAENQKLIAQSVKDQETIRLLQAKDLTQILGQIQNGKDIIDTTEKLKDFIERANENNVLIGQLDAKYIAEIKTLNEKLDKYSHVNLEDYAEYEELKQKYNVLQENYRETELKIRKFFQNKLSDGNLIDALNNYNLTLKETDKTIFDNMLNEIQGQITGFENSYETMSKRIKDIKDMALLPELQGPMFARLFTQLDQQIKTLQNMDTIQTLIQMHGSTLKFDSDNPFFDNPNIKPTDTLAPALLSAFFTTKLMKLKAKITDEQQELINQFQQLDAQLTGQQNTAQPMDSMDTVNKFVEFRTQFLTLENQASETLNNVIGDLYTEIRKYSNDLKKLTPQINTLAQPELLTDLVKEHVDNLKKQAEELPDMDELPDIDMDDVRPNINVSNYIVQRTPYTKEALGTLNRNSPGDISDDLEIPQQDEPHYLPNKPSMQAAEIDIDNPINYHDDTDLEIRDIQTLRRKIKKNKTNRIDKDEQLKKIHQLLLNLGNELKISIGKFPLNIDIKVLSQQIITALSLRDVENKQKLEKAQHELLEAQRENKKLPKLTEEIIALKKELLAQKTQLDQQAKLLATPTYQIEQSKRPEDRNYTGDENEIIKQLKKDNYELKHDLDRQIATLNLELKHVQDQLSERVQLQTMQLSDADKKDIDLNLTICLSAIKEEVKNYFTNHPDDQKLAEFLEQINQKILVDSALVIAHVEQAQRNKTTEAIRLEYQETIDIIATHKKWKNDIADILAEKRYFETTQRDLKNQVAQLKLTLQTNNDQKDEELEKIMEENIVLLQVYQDINDAIKTDTSLDIKKYIDDQSKIKDYIAFLIENKKTVNQDVNELETKLKQAEFATEKSKKEQIELDEKYRKLEKNIEEKYPDFTAQIPLVGKMPHALSSSSAKIILTTEQSQLQGILDEMNNLKAIIDDPDKKNDDDVKNQVDNIINFITRLKTQQTSVKTGGYMPNKLQPYNFEFMFIITLLIILSLYLLYLVYSYHDRSKRIYQVQQSCQIKSRQGKFKSATDNYRPKNWPEIQSESQPVKKIRHPYVI